MGIQYSTQQQYLNVGLPPQCRDGGYFIFITLNKEDLAPAHDYADLLFADQFIWSLAGMSRRTTKTTSI